MNNERLGHILLRQGLISAQKLDFCLKVQKNNGGERLGRVLKHYDFINDVHIAQALAQQVGWEVYPGAYTPDEESVALLTIPFLLERMVFPAQTQDGTVFILGRTDDMSTTDLIEERLQRKVKFYIGPELSLRKALEQLTEQQGIQPAESKEMQDNLITWLEGHLNLAIAKGATDIHIEPSQKAVEIRFRIDGILHFIDSLRLSQLPRLVNIIFHKADVTVSDFQHVHDGRFTHQYLNRPVDIRVSHIPGIHGSSLVLRLLDKGKTASALTQLGYGQKQWELIRDDLVKPEGITLIVGPTGCGKTTTLYAMLNHLKSISTKIVTIEDPVEIHLPLMTQVQMNEKRGITFSDAVRAFLRHDPDIMLIGEIRDQHTAQEALRAAMTGHKVFATLHANRPLDAILRLSDLGVPFTHLAGNLSMVITQRLLRRLCTACKTAQAIRKSDLAPYQHKYIESEHQEVFAAQGCPQCSQGFCGRVIASEVLNIDDEILAMMGEGRIMHLRGHLKHKAYYWSMLNDVRRLLQEGQTTIEEAVRVLGSEFPSRLYSPPLVGGARGGVNR